MTKITVSYENNVSQQLAIMLNKTSNSKLKYSLQL